MASSTLLIVFLVVLQTWTFSVGQDCDLASYPPPVEISETDGPRILLNVSGGPSANWSFNVETYSQFLNPYFRLEQDLGNATISLKKTLDLEEIYGQLGQIVNNIEGKLSCSQPGAQDVYYEWYAFVQPVNEFPPEFVRLPDGGFNVSEATRVGDIVFVLKNYVEDRDVVPNDLGYDFTFIPYTVDPRVDGRSVLAVDNSLIGSTILSKELDFETMERSKAFYILHITVADRDNTKSLTSTGTVRINVIDADDQPPEFYYPGCSSPCFVSYSAAITTDFVGPVDWLQPPIKAKDRDTLGSQITFSLKQGDPTYFTDYLVIDPSSGVPSVIKQVEEAETASFLIILEAREMTELGHSMQTTLWLVIEGRNLSLPRLPSTESTADTFRIVTIVLGCLLGLVLILFTIFVVVTTLTSKKKTIPVLPKAIGTLSSDTTTTGIPTDDRSVCGSYRSDREADTSINRRSATRKVSGDSGVDFLRSLSTPSGMGPALRPGSFLRTEPDMETLPVNDEIHYINSATRQRGHRLSTVSAHAPFNEDRMGLVGNLSEEVMGGMANPALYEDQHEERALDVAVVPLEQAHVQI